MKIGLDYIATIGGGGNQAYSQNIIKNLAASDKENKYYLFGFTHDYFLRRNIFNVKAPNFKFFPAYFSRLKFPISDDFVRQINKRSLRFFTKIKKIDIFHFTNPLNFIFGANNSIVTIHDLSVLHNHEWAKKSSLDFFQKNMKKILSEAKAIISVSEFTKKDIINFYNIEEKKIFVVYEAASDDFFYEESGAHLKEKFGLEKYILYTGQLQPRKNILRLLKAYSLLDDNLRNQYNLVLAGSSRNKDFLKEVYEEIKNLKIEENIKILGFVEIGDLRKLYSQAKLFIYPSLFEGFGIPVLESLKCGTPVLTSKTSSMPEVAGDAAILVDPENVQEISLSIKRMLENENEYNKYKSRCLEQANKFSWERAAKETLAVYEEVYKNVL